MENIHILLVEDDDELAFVTKLQLEGEGFVTDVAGDGASTMDLVNSREYDVILLDVMLPDCNGHELCERIRKVSDVPVIFMSCLGDGNTVINAFRTGGNDYLIKPVNINELKERIAASLSSGHNKGIMRFKQFAVNKDTMTVYRCNAEGEIGNIINVSGTEYKILMAFIEHKEELLFHKDLYRIIWEQGEVEDLRTLMVHVSNLRKKIDFMQRNSIRTVRGAGYIFSDL